MRVMQESKPRKTAGELTEGVNKGAEATEKRRGGSPELSSIGTEFNSLLQVLNIRTSEWTNEIRALKKLMAEGYKRNPRVEKRRGSAAHGGFRMKSEKGRHWETVWWNNGPRCPKSGVRNVDTNSLKEPQLVFSKEKEPSHSVRRLKSHRQGQ